MTEAQQNLLDAVARSTLRLIADLPNKRGIEWTQDRYFQPKLLNALADFTRERFPQLYSGTKRSGSTPLWSGRPSDTVSPQD